MGLSRQEYWSGVPCPPPGDLPNPGIEPVSLMSLALAGGFFTTGVTWEAQRMIFTVELASGTDTSKWDAVSVFHPNTNHNTLFPSKKYLLCLSFSYFLSDSSAYRVINSRKCTEHVWDMAEAEDPNLQFPWLVMLELVHSTPGCTGEYKYGKIDLPHWAENYRPRCNASFGHLHSYVTGIHLLSCSLFSLCIKQKAFMLLYFSFMLKKLPFMLKSYFLVYYFNSIVVSYMYVCIYMHLCIC